MSMEDKMKKLKRLVAESDNIVFFGGAGVSTESGIPDFRSAEGLFSLEYNYPPETILSHTFFMQNPEEFYRFHRVRLVNDGARPNKAHMKLAELERMGKLRAVITQNIDGLHQMAGSVNVLELHGSAHRFYCMSCGKAYEPYPINHGEGTPRCECGGIIRPDVVLYEESLDSDILNSAVGFVRRADMLIVGGTSLNVYPAAGLVNYYRGEKLVLINRGATQYDRIADLHIQERIGEVLSQVM